MIQNLRQKIGNRNISEAADADEEIRIKIEAVVEVIIPSEAVELEGGEAEAKPKNLKLSV